MSCSKESACFHSYGDETNSPIINELEDFNSFILDGSVGVNLVKDSLNFMEILGGKNAIEFVNYTIANKDLIVTNESKCNWLRNYEKRVQVNLHFKDLRTIRNLSDGIIKNEDKLNFDTITIHQNGTGEINLNVSAERVWVDSYVIGDVELQGSCNSMIATIGSFGNLKAKKMKAGWISVTTIHEGDAHVFPVNAMKARCEQLGDIYYYNDVENPNITESEEGKVELVLE